MMIPKTLLAHHVAAAAFLVTTQVHAQPLGPIVAWGNNFAGQAVSQPGSFIAASGTSSTSVAVRSDGSLFAWGDSDNPAFNVPSGAFTDVYGGGSFYIARRTDGTLAGWGDNLSGQSSPPSGTFKKAAGGQQHALGVRGDGSLAYWGVSWGGVVPAGNDFVDVAAGLQFSMALRSDGTIAAWGVNDRGQLNVPTGSYKAVVAMENAGAAIRADGTVAVWGSLHSAGALEGLVVSRIVASGNGGTVIALLPDGTLGSLSGLPPIVPAGTYSQIGAGEAHWFAIVPAPSALLPLVGAGAMMVSRRRRA